MRNTELKRHFDYMAGLMTDILMIVWVYALLTIFLGMIGLGIGGLFWMYYQAVTWVLS